MGNLHEHPGTIAGFIIRAFRAPVLHQLQDLKAPAQNSVGRTAPNIRYKANSAGIMLILFPIQTLGTLMRPLLMFTHDGSLQQLR
jgi:hypothetical protein